MDRPDPTPLFFPLVASLTLGLAPFAPEPHIVGKVRWILGGANGMTATDWFDFAMHGAPWVWLLVATSRLVATRLNTPKQPETHDGDAN